MYAKEPSGKSVVRHNGGGSGGGRAVAVARGVGWGVEGFAREVEVDGVWDVV